MSRVAVLGLGAMGHAIAAKLLEGEPRIAVLQDKPQGLMFTVFMNGPGDERLAAVEAIPGPFTTSREGPRNNVVRFTPPRAVGFEQVHERFPVVDPEGHHGALRTSSTSSGMEASSRMVFRCGRVVLLKVRQQAADDIDQMFALQVAARWHVDNCPGRRSAVSLNTSALRCRRGSRRPDRAWGPALAASLRRSP